jgi:hypothetical protein
MILAVVLFIICLKKIVNPNREVPKNNFYHDLNNFSQARFEQLWFEQLTLYLNYSIMYLKKPVYTGLGLDHSRKNNLSLRNFKNITFFERKKPHLFIQNAAAFYENKCLQSQTTKLKILMTKAFE